MPERFFAGGCARVYRAAEQLTLLYGPRACGKTSLLFQFAINCAAESGRDVVYVCNKQRMEFKPPFVSQGVDPALPILGSIQMKYVEDDHEIKKYFAAFHLHDIFPAAVVIDDFGDFFNKGKSQHIYPQRNNTAMVRLLALCQDAISHANSMLQPSGSCKLLLSDTHKGQIPRFLFIYKRWIQSIFIIEGDGIGPFLLKNMASPGNLSTRMRTAKYSLSSQLLVLEEMAEE
ncbi:hypothetical protein HPP92_007040 [Vanilla planifolia]|uniref:Uncharacterized protein n=1 Tax=Vanilla planifolia TaxID=51239 RepID=A0A835V5I4_VANPL|nr:hypothetical protein HPP92_007040 [Vanilla planifolia]